MKKRIVPVILGRLLMLSLLPLAALAVSNPGSYIFDVSEGSVNVSATDETCALDIRGTSAVNLTVNGSGNVLKSGSDQTGLVCDPART